jgi:hypothetical protein
MEKILFVERHTTKRRRRSNQNYLARKMFQQKYLGFFWFKVWEYPLSTKASTKGVPPVWKVKIYYGTDNLKTKIRQLQGYM